MVSIATAAPQQPSTATWIPSESSIRGGESLRTVIKMNVNDGWHTYWTNPGEVGIPLALKAELPEGWSIGEIQYPAPKRFMTGELASYGYEGEIIFPVTITPPAGTEGKIPPLRTTLSWLTCNEKTCIPGKAQLKLSSSANPKLVATAYETLPLPLPDAKLTIISADEFIQMTLTLAADSDIHPSDYEIFPVTPNIIDPAAKPRFEPNPTTPHAWISTAPKSEYFTDNLEGLTLVLKGKNGTFYQVSSK